MKQTNESIKSFDYTRTSESKLQDALISELNGLPLVLMKIQKGRPIFRCRKHSKINESFHFGKDLSYRTDIRNITHLGRCNYYESSKFYGAISSADISEGYATAVMETSSLLRDDVDGYERYTIGMWKAKEDIEVMAIKPPDNEVKDSIAYKELINEFKKSQTHLKFTDEHHQFYDLLGIEMSKKVNKNENHKYAISALVSEILLQTEKGIVYPSVQSESKGLNVVFNPSTFDKHFKLEVVLIADFFKFGKESLLRNLFECPDASIYPFVFQDVPSQSYLSLKQVIAYFESKGISSLSIISGLLEQSARN